MGSRSPQCIGALNSSTYYLGNNQIHKNTFELWTVRQKRGMCACVWPQTELVRGQMSDYQ